MSPGDSACSRGDFCCPKESVMRLVSLLAAGFFSFALPPPLVHAAEKDDLSRGPLDAKDEAELARTAKLETIVRVALARNQELAESHDRALAAQARGRSAS